MALAWGRHTIDVGAETVTGAWTYSTAPTFSAVSPPFIVSSASATTVTNLSAQKWNGVTGATPATANRIFQVSSTTAGSWVAPSQDLSLAAGGSFSVVGLSGYPIDTGSSAGDGRTLIYLSSTNKWTMMDPIFNDNQFILTDNGSATKRASFQVSSLSAARTFTFPNVAGTFVTSANPYNLIGAGVFTVGGILYASTTTALSELAVGTDGQVLTLVSGLPSWVATHSVSAKTASYTVVSADRFKTFTNEGASASVPFALPTAAAGEGPFTFVVQDSDGLSVVAGTGDTIRMGSSVTSSAGSIASTTVGDRVTVVAINATEWVAEWVTTSGWSFT